MSVADLWRDATVRSGLLAAGVSFGLSLLAGPFVIAILRRHARERINSASARLDELHAGKQHTPTMGGLLIVGAVGLALIVTRIGSPLIQLALGLMLALGAIGARDDWLKLTGRGRGMTARRKLFAQTVVAVTAACVLKQLDQPREPVPGEHFITEITNRLHAGWWLILWAAFLIVASSNAVNLTDGLDGLASGCTSLSGLALLIIAVFWMSPSESQADAVAITAALTGSSLGFLVFNRHPARVFMGDTGSLPIGGLLALTALVLRREFVFAVVAGVFVVETVSVIVQVVWFRRTGRRVLLCSPLHNHFVFQRITERRIVTGFWIAAIACAGLGLILAWLLKPAAGGIVR